MDKNQATGLILISVMLVLYFQFFGAAPEQQPQQIEETNTVGQIEQTSQTVRENTISAISDSVASVENIAKYGSLAFAATGIEEDVVVENDGIKIAFSSRGAKIKNVLIKDYLTHSKEPLVLLDENSSRTSLFVNQQGRQVDIYDLYYQASTTKTDSSTVVTFAAINANNQSIKHIYNVLNEGYQVRYGIELDGFADVANADWVLNWENDMKATEKDPVASRAKASLNFYLTDGSFEELGERAMDFESESAGNVKWIAFKQHFFTAALVADNKFSQVEVTQEAKEQFEEVDKFTTARLTIPSADVRSGSAKFTYFFGPNNYPLLKSVTPDFELNLYLGWTPVNYVNKFVIIPIFNWLKNYISNYGIIIIILVLIIKLFLSPLSYKSYVSMAKMKVLKPELDELKEKTGGDAQKMQQEQMKLYRQVGVNPLSGCIPMVLQMPILFAMFYFFPGSIELRQEAFLWADDLSTYDSIMSLPFTIPFYGDHVSLFTILMTVSTILYTWSNNQVSSVQGPMKSMSYMMPVIFMFVLNSFPAALSFYYFVSNIITFGQQALIRRFVDEDKIKVILEENREKNQNKKKSKFQQRLDQALKAGDQGKKKK